MVLREPWQSDADGAPEPGLPEGPMAKLLTGTTRTDRGRERQRPPPTNTPPSTAGPVNNTNRPYSPVQTTPPHTRRRPSSAVPSRFVSGLFLDPRWTSGLQCVRRGHRPPTGTDRSSAGRSRQMRGWWTQNRRKQPGTFCHNISVTCWKQTLLPW